ncbi:hypothetical protein N9I30_02010, partial [Flavobacteriales bacterium]|nr:hypothetical protein [Flavobacteriales bacterium]
MLIPFFAFAQKSEQQLAYQYYVNGEYDKAISIYEELMDKHFSVAYYNPYFISLLKVEDFKSAEYLAKKLVKKHPNSLNYQLEVAVVQEMSGNIKKAERSYKKLFAKIDGGQLQAINLANTFSRYEMYEKALDVYATAYKQNSQNNFGTQKAQLYSLLG